LPDFGIWNAQTDYSGKVIHFVLESRGKWILQSSRNNENINNSKGCSHHNSVRPSACPSRRWFSQKRCKWGSPNFHHWLSEDS